VRRGLENEVKPCTFPREPGRQAVQGVQVPKMKTVLLVERLRSRRLGKKNIDDGIVRRKARKRRESRKRRNAIEVQEEIKIKYKYIYFYNLFTVNV